MAKRRFVTFDVRDQGYPPGEPEIIAFEENERWQAFMEQGEWDEFIWQYADSHEQAISQHDEKYVAFRDDEESGRSTKGTY